ncbi:hypothetical protein BSTEL_2162 [Bifidobacterium stellenboschense]|uniref:Uncharacterized protein n=1 Tax=Bifidobacterium stellenboschense TaxID=762211 RepID=A0A087DAM9_9BIFI|nr:hypothetical protein BSTEL_2162 [Bifidobacterium stellenboschense]
MVRKVERGWSGAAAGRGGGGSLPQSRCAGQPPRQRGPVLPTCLPKVLYFGLGAEEAGVLAAVEGHEFGVRAGFDASAVIEDDDMVRVFGVGHAVRDHDDRPAVLVREVADRVEDERLAFHVDAAGRLVEHVDPRVVQKGACDGDALALPAGQVRGVLFDHHVESIGLRAHEIVDAGTLQRLPHHRIRIRRGVVVDPFRQRHREVVAQRAGEQVAARADHRDGARQRLAGKRRDLDAGETQRAGVSGERAGEQRGGRRFAGTGDADDGGELAGTRVEGDVGERGRDVGAARRAGRVAGTVAGTVAVRVGDVVERDVETGVVRFGQVGVAALRFGRVEQCEDAFRGGHAVHRDVEERAELAQRDEEVGGQQDDEQQRGERHRRAGEREQVGHEIRGVGEPAVHVGRPHGGGRARGRATGGEAPQGDADAGRGAAVGDRVHRGEGTQLDLEDAHRHHAEVLGLVVEFAGGARVGVERLQRLEALQVVEERGAHVRVAAPVFLERAGGAHRDHADHDDDERRADEERDGGRQVHRRDHGEQGERREDRVEQLRQEQVEERLDLFDALAGGLDDVGGLHTLRVGGAEREHLAVQLLAQREFDAFGGLGAEARGSGRRQISHDRGGDDDETVEDCVARHRRDGVAGTGEQVREQGDDRRHERDVGEQTHPHAGDLTGDQTAYAGYQPEQSFVEHVSPFRRSQATVTENEAEWKGWWQSTKDDGAVVAWRTTRARLRARNLGDDRPEPRPRHRDMRIVGRRPATEERKER